MVSYFLICVYLLPSRRASNSTVSDSFGFLWTNGDWVFGLIEPRPGFCPWSWKIWEFANTDKISGANIGTFVWISRW